MSYPVILNLAQADILAERERQDKKWGEQNHDPFTYLTVLAEEIGEFSEEALTLRFGNLSNDGVADVHGRMRTEAVQTAAVAMAIVECIDRAKWRWPVEERPSSGKWQPQFPDRPGRYWGSENLGDWQPPQIVTFERMGGIMEASVDGKDWYREHEVSGWIFWSEPLSAPAVPEDNT